MAWRGCAIKWAKTGFIRSQNTTSRSSSLNPYNQQRYWFYREAKRPNTKKINSTQETNASPAEAGTPVPQCPKAPRPTLFTPLMFTVGFTGCSFGAAAILQYERLKSKLQTAEDNDKSEKSMQMSQDMAHLHDMWNQLSSFQQQVILLIVMVDDFCSSFTEGQKTITGIIAVNAAVLCCWRIPAMRRSMLKYFTSNPACKTRCLPMALCAFSHYSFIHMVSNMYVLWTFSPVVLFLFGKEQFLAVYLSAGVIASMASYICKIATGRFRSSLGASGAVMAVFAAACSRLPEATFNIIYLPMVTFTAGNLLKAVLAIDIVGLLLGWKLLDHAGHLGGALFGVWYMAYGHEIIWSKRKPLVKLWHDMRSRDSGGSKPGGPEVGGGGGPSS